MRILLDTHVLLWWLSGNEAISIPARAAIGDADNETFVSAASAWEIAIKYKRGRLPTAASFAGDPARIYVIGHSSGAHLAGATLITDWPRYGVPADVIKGATILPNPNGSAPGQWIDTLYEGYRKLIMLIPGPPAECIPLFDAECLPRLREILPPRFISKRVLKAAMIPESQADKLLAPILDGRADVVYGSRFLSGPQRVHYFWHYVANRMLTLLSDIFTNLKLTDMETCYKVFRKEVLAGIQLKSDRFGFEPEITAKIAKHKWRIYEVPITYAGRTYEEGKKITWKDGIQALWCIIRYSVGD